MLTIAKRCLHVLLVKNPDLASACKPVFIRTTDSKTGAVSKLGAMLGILN